MRKVVLATGGRPHGGVRRRYRSGDVAARAVYKPVARATAHAVRYVPDAGHRGAIERALADPEVHAVALTTEEEGVALMAGADLGGARGVLLMQWSGVGNCINLLSWPRAGLFRCCAWWMRGDFGEGNPWQFPMGQAVEPVLEAMGVIEPGRRAREVVPTVSAGADDGISGRPGGGRAARAAPDRRQEVLMGGPRGRDGTTRMGSK